MFNPLIFIVVLFVGINRLESIHEDSYRLEMIARSEGMNVQFPCDLNDVAWWKRPNLLATRYGVILPKYHSKMSFERSNGNHSVQSLTINQLQSNDSGVYECETLGGIRLFNLTVIVRLTTVELGVQYDHPTNANTSSRLANDRLINLRENQFLRLTCVVSRALPAAILHFPFDVDYRIERNSTIENDDRTYRTILVLIVRINRFFHQRHFHCQAIQIQNLNHEHIRIRSNTLQIDVTYSPICSQKSTVVSQLHAGIDRPINLTCHMRSGNPPTNNFTWHLPNGNVYPGYSLNTTSSYLTIIPKSWADFGQVICRAQNELGLSGECHMNMTLGGVPDPIRSCQYAYLNSTLTVNCVAGFHQGDEEFFCYMYKRQQNGSYSEHARLKGNCAFILPDLKAEYHHDFRVFTRNKFGDNFDRSYSITVGKPKTESLADRTRTYWPYMTLFTIGAFLASFILICCLCHRIRKAMYNKRIAKGNFEGLTYHNHNSHVHSNGKTSLVREKPNSNGGTVYPTRPYRSKDHLISSEPSNLHRTNAYLIDDEPLPNRRSIFKETDLDRTFHSTMRTLPLNNRHRTLMTPTNSQRDQTHPFPVSIPRRSSFEEATKLNSLDFYTTSEPFYFLDKQFIRSSHAEREKYRHTLIVENRMNSSTDPSTSNEENKNLILTQENPFRDEGIFV